MSEGIKRILILASILVWVSFVRYVIVPRYPAGNGENPWLDALVTAFLIPVFGCAVLSVIAAIVGWVMDGFEQDRGLKP